MPCASSIPLKNNLDNHKNATADVILSTRQVAKIWNEFCELARALNDVADYLFDRPLMFRHKNAVYLMMNFIKTACDAA
jgi:hypothetical protein